MDSSELKRRATRAVAEMSDAAVRRIASADEASVVIALSSEESADDEVIAAVRRLVHRLCRERVARGTSLAG
jgi:hypothetical protein